MSIDKHCVRPIVRGKEVKRVEFGAKLNMIQIDGINFIEQLSFDTFHKGIRLVSSIELHRQLFGVCTHIATDAVYATNANRSWCTAQNITTNFLRKGRATEDEKQRSQMRTILSKERAIRMEGSFGTEKRHYGLHRTKARTRKTETLWIFFGVHTANAVRMISKITPEEVPKKAA